MKIENYIEKTIALKLLSVDNVDEARNIISMEINNLNDGIQEIFNDNQYNVAFLTHFGDNYFPKKEYKGINYEAGTYESLVVGG